MRILPITNGYNQVNKTNKKIQTQFERNSSFGAVSAHRYTGVASADLAYASMFDSAIAKDLKLMGLI